MLMSKVGYFAEFLVFPPFLATLTFYVFTGEDPPALGRWLAAMAAGAFAWTLIEYLLHRFCFHHAPVISNMHELHHAEPMKLIGSPAWLSFGFGAAFVLVPLWTLLGPGDATAVTTGIAAGYLWYIVVHYGSHHWTPRRGGYLYRARMRHARHHYAPEAGNFGVTTAFWDHVFGTALDGRRTRERSWSDWLWGYWPWRGA